MIVSHLIWMYTFYFLGVHFKKKEGEVMQDYVMLAMKVFFHAVDAMLHERSIAHASSTLFSLGWSDFTELIQYRDNR